MSDEGEKMCPLCAEEMDLTDQQLKPCKCGYEICVWCWHHIMDMAEKDDTEGRCPACRNPYDKEKIVGMAANCERLVSEISTERKKMQKSKSKTNEGRKQLTSVRVIQRNLVYIVGLPINLGDEDLLQRKEYFGQYGKVLKVSISRTSAGSIQQFPNSTCSVYITYSKEDEAVRCIQSVHGFILDGRSLRACFGTTKYCHAWLRNAVCNNPDCLYLHEVGSQVDSFTKDEIISAYTRNRVQQITGASNIMQRRSGNSLPPPSDDYCSNSSAPSAKPAVKGAANVIRPQTPVTSVVRASTPPGSSGRTCALPPAASWGARPLNVQSSGESMLNTNGPCKHKPEAAASGSVASTTTVSGCNHASGVDVEKQPLLAEGSGLKQPTGKLEYVEHLKCHDGANPGKDVPQVSVTSSGPASMVTAGWLPNSVVQTDDTCKEIGVSSSAQPHVDAHMNLSSMEMERDAFHDAQPQKHSADASSMGVDKQVIVDDSKFIQRNGFSWDIPLTGNHGLLLGNAEKYGDQFVSPVAKVSSSTGNLNTSQDIHQPVDVFASGFTVMKSSPSVNFINNHFMSPLQHTNPDGSVNYNGKPPVLHINAGTSSSAIASAACVESNGYLENFISSSYMDDRLLSDGTGIQTGRFKGETETTESDRMLDIESSIISNILSLDLDGWDESLTSPHDVAKMLGEADKQHASYGIPSSWKAQNSNQSRFSFARQEEYRNPLFDAVPSFSMSGQGSMSHPFSQAFSENREAFVHPLGNGLGHHQRNAVQPDSFSNNHPGFSSSKNSATKAHTSAPPGFTMPSRLPPPGFSSHDRSGQIMDVKSGIHSLDASSFGRNAYQVSPGGNLSGHGDIEFMDPAILAVGKGRLSNGGMSNLGLDVRSVFHVQSATPGSEVKHQGLMHSSVTPHQNPRYGGITDSFIVPNDAYTFTSRHIEESAARNRSPIAQLPLHQPRNSVMSNGRWEAWGERQAGNDIADTPRNERQGFNKLYGGYEDPPKFQMPSSANLYNRRTFGM